ncbi:unnamed protein product [marine sediment metagenome]|uniref:Uncharacterized protein n=1 Tax=marine sediment metagenome TaxID=412755 RepID=X1PZD3_9ZZZZ
MAIIKEMVGQKVIDGFKGVIDFYYYMGVPCARAWPKSPGKSRSANVMAQWPVFKTAAQLWGELSPEVRQAYEDMAAVTNLTGKDMFFRGYISGTLRYYVPPGELEG